MTARKTRRDAKPRKKAVVAQPAISVPISSSKPHHGRAVVCPPPASPPHKTMQLTMERRLKATLARATAGLSPIALGAAWSDWALHLVSAPGKQLELLEKAGRKARRLGNYANHCANACATTEASCTAGNPDICIAPLPQDRRFEDESWQKWPFNLMYQGFLLNQQWWHNATTGVAGVTRQHEDVVEFAARQMLDVFSPSNFALTNPEVLARTTRTGGMNLFRGWQNLWGLRCSRSEEIWQPRRARLSIATA